LANIQMASFATFLVSGIFHDLVVFFLMPSQPLGLATAFFVINGVFCSVQVAVQSATGWGTGALWKFLGWAMTMYLLLLTSPLFSHPWLATRYHFNVPVPDVVNEFCLRHFW
ncbi:hypothetical protein HDU98_009611, partial [Podochytrium sp. JEL0797]